MTKRRKLTNPIGRATDEWIGKSADTPFPPRVRLRIFERAGGKCEECGRKLGPADKWDVDHTLAIINGGENRERNACIKCEWCHPIKTAKDVAQKSKSYRVRAKHNGVKTKTYQWPKRKMNEPFFDNSRDVND